MLTYAADFWPVFWTIIGSGAALTVLLSVLVATFPVSRSNQRHHLKPLHLAVSRHDHGTPEQLSKAA